MFGLDMVLGLAVGALRVAAIIGGALWAFVAFGSLTSHLVGSVPLQVGVAVMMGLVTATVVDRVVASSEIPRMLSHVR